MAPALAVIGTLGALGASREPRVVQSAVAVPLLPPLLEETVGDEVPQAAKLKTALKPRHGKPPARLKSCFTLVSSLCNVNALTIGAAFPQRYHSKESGAWVVDLTSRRQLGRAP